MHRNGIFMIESPKMVFPLFDPTTKGGKVFKGTLTLPHSVDHGDLDFFIFSVF